MKDQDYITMFLLPSELLGFQDGAALVLPTRILR